MTFTIRNAEFPKDFERMAYLFNLIETEEETAESVEKDYAKIPLENNLTLNEQGLATGYGRIKLVAENQDGLVIGFAQSWRAPWGLPGEFVFNLIVDTEYRNKGLGTALFERLKTWTEGVGGKTWTTEVRDFDEASLRFAKNRGFEFDRHVFESVLEVDGLQVEKMRKELGDRKPGGIRFSTLADMPGPESEQKMYELCKRTFRDIPGVRETEYLDFKEWSKWFLEPEGSTPDLVLVALDGDRWVGLTRMKYHKISNSLYNGYTAVNADYRGRGIALELKLRCIELAQRKNVSYIRTHNDSLNGPMLKVNRDKLGYQPVPGYYKLIRKPIEPA